MSCYIDGRQGGHWRKYHEMVVNHPDLVESLATAIHAFAARHRRFTGSDAAANIFQTWDGTNQWLQMCGDLSRPVLSVAIYVLLKDERSITERIIRGTKILVYTQRRCFS